jgi:AcrR family transcriptional regulator
MTDESVFIEPMPKITDAQRDARRQQILDAALRCFSRDGFHATTTADIVRESGVSQGTLYLYFATKDDIIVALAHDRRQGEALINAMAAGEQDPLEGLSLMLELYGQSLSDTRRLDERRVGIQGWAEALRNPVIRTSVTANLSAVRREIVSLVERGQASGQVRAGVDPDGVARTLIALFQGLILQVCWGEHVELDAVGPVIREMVLSLFTEAGRRAAHFQTKD